MIEAAVDLRRVEIFCDQRQRIEFRAGAFRINAAAPIGIRPTGRTHANVSQCAHEKILSDKEGFVEDDLLPVLPRVCGCAARCAGSLWLSGWRQGFLLVPASRRSLEATNDQRECDG